MSYYMNPFDFVPLPENGPIQVPDEISNSTERYEGIINYSIHVKTTLHISGKIQSGRERDETVYSKKYFLRNMNNDGFVIPGSSIRGMLASYIEALTGSDFGAITMGDESEKYDNPNNVNTTYGKWDGTNNIKGRHVGFKIQGSNHTNGNKKAALNYRPGAFKYERLELVPKNFSRMSTYDTASYLFGQVSNEDKIAARKSRFVFDDINIAMNSIKVIDAKALDVVGSASMGSPNPRANTAWYFTPGEKRKRTVHRGNNTFDVWEVLAKKMRGRKFYFHQHPMQCYDYYDKNWNENNPDNNNGFMPLKKYDVESIAPRQKIAGGRIQFSNLSLTALKLICSALELSPSMAHKLGAMKPFGFGSVALEIDGIQYRSQNDVLSEWQTDRDTINDQDTSMLIYSTADEWLKKIMHYPDFKIQKEKDNYKFYYPPFNFNTTGTQKKGFALTLLVRDYHDQPTPETCEKITMYFDEYQKSATNFGTVMGDLDYQHGW